MSDVGGFFGRALPGARLPGFASGTRSSNPVASWSRRRHALFGARLHEQTPKDNLHTRNGVRHTLSDRCALFVAWSILTSTILPSIRLLKVRCKRSGYVAGRVPIRVDVSYLGTFFSAVVFLFATSLAKKATAYNLSVLYVTCGRVCACCNLYIGCNLHEGSIRLYTPYRASWDVHGPMGVMRLSQDPSRWI